MMLLYCSEFSTGLRIETHESTHRSESWDFSGQSLMSVGGLQLLSKLGTGLVRL